MICVIRGEPSAVPRRWVGLIVAAGDACLLPLAGRPAVEHVIERARPQVSSLLLCPAGDPSLFACHGLPLVTAGAGDPAGLLAAVLAGLDWTAAHSRETPWVATFAADVPVFPGDLVERLGQAVGKQGADMAWALADGRPMPLFGLWPVRLRRALRRALKRQPALAAEQWAARFRPVQVDFPSPSEPFAAIRGPEDLTSLAAYMGAGVGAPTGS
jgi:molybdopterin-guanine dinucleotide biosynthesis protein A